MSDKVSFVRDCTMGKLTPWANASCALVSERNAAMVMEVNAMSFMVAACWNRFDRVLFGDSIVFFYEQDTA